MVPKLRFSKFSQKWTKIRLGNYLQNYQKRCLLILIYLFTLHLDKG